MKLYKEYIKELFDYELVSNDKYFFTYTNYEDNTYLIDVYIKEEERNKGLCVDIIKKVEKIAEKNNKKYVTSSINKNLKDDYKKRSHIILTKNNYFQFKEDDNLVYYIKEL